SPCTTRSTPRAEFQVGTQLGTWNLKLLLRPLGLPLLDILGRAGPELVAAAGAADVVGLPLVAHGDRPEPAADDALPLGGAHVRERHPLLGHAHEVFLRERRPALGLCFQPVGDAVVVE